MARDWCKFCHDAKPIALMVIVQIVFAGVTVLYKIATNAGMNLRVLVAYRFVFATAFLGPVAFFAERKTRQKLTWTIAFQSFLCGLFGGALSQNLYIASMKLTSATFVAAMTNLIPAITFILAVIFKLERLAIRTLSSQAKVLGTVIGIGGAMLLTFYKGVELNIWPWKTNLLKNKSAPSSHHESGNPVMGSLLAVASCFCYAIWLIIQAKMSENYPSHYSSTALMCFMACIQSVAYALIMDHDLSTWKLGWDIRLLTVFYAGIIGSGLTVSMMAWSIRKRGPLFVSVFNPLLLIVVAIVGSILLNEKLHLGSVLGSVLIIFGLYAVLWGKQKEMEKIVKLPVRSCRENIDAETRNTEMGVSNLGSKPDPKESKTEEISVIAM